MMAHPTLCETRDRMRAEVFRHGGDGLHNRSDRLAERVKKIFVEGQHQARISYVENSRECDPSHTNLVIVITTIDGRMFRCPMTSAEGKTLAVMLLENL